MIQNSCVNHAVTAYGKHENIIVAANQVTRNRIGLFDVLDSKNRNTCSNLANQRYRNKELVSPGIALAHQLQSTRLSSITLNEAILLQLLQMIMHAGTGG